MTIFRIALVLAVGLGGLALNCATARTEDYRVNRFDGMPAADAIATGVADRMAAQGLGFSEGEATLCRLWLAKQLPVDETVTVSDTVLYPFTAGDLLGVVQYEKTGNDFRGQEIAPGWYTIRYGQQPVDGNHIGTSDTRDFLLLLPAAADTDPERLGEERLFELSKEAAQSNHPCMLALLRAASDGDAPSVLHDENRELWSVRVEAETAKGKLPVELVLVGRFPE